MEKKAGKVGRPKSAKEPAMYVGVTKTCTFCNCTNVEFKFLNNKSMQQPRYKCLGCNKLFTHNPTSRRKRHPHGYSKIAMLQELPKNATVLCLNPSFEKVGTSEFLFFNNDDLTQPRCRCGSCKTTFTQGGRSKGNFDHGSMQELVHGVRCVELLNLSSKRRFDDNAMGIGEQYGTGEVIAQPQQVSGNCNKKLKLSSQQREFHDSGDEDSEIDEEELAQLDEMAKMDILRHMNVEKNQDSDSDSDEEEEEPSEFVETPKLCNWCKSPNTEFCRTLKSSGLLEYQCQDCCAHLKFDGETQRVLPIERQSRTTKYNLRCTTNLVES